MRKGVDNVVSSFEKAFIRQGMRMTAEVLKLYCQGFSEEEIAARTKYGLEFVTNCILDFNDGFPQNGVPLVP